MKIIALEEHFATAAYDAKFPADPRRSAALADFSERLGHDPGVALLDLGARRIAAMDAAGIDRQILSLTMPGCQAFDGPTAIPLARDANDRLHEAVQAHPTRFSGFAALPTADPAASVRELERAVATLGFKGAMINSHTQGEFLDDRKYWGIFEAAQALRVPIYLHPREPPPPVLAAYFKGYEDLSHAAWGFALETCTHFLRLVFAGVFDAFPDLKIILGHLGEGLPFWLQRLDVHTRGAAGRRGLKKSAGSYLRENLAVTCSGHFFTPAVLCTVMALGIDNLLFAVDWPFESNHEAVDFLAQLPLSPADKEKIAHGNAERLLRL